MAVGRGGIPDWALPAELAAVDGRTLGRRTVRDWLVDLALFAAALLVWAWMFNEMISTPDPAYLAAVPAWMHAVDPWLGLAACVGLWWRRRFPLVLAVAMVPALSVAGTALGAALASVFTVAVHRGWRPAAAITAVQMAQVLWFALEYQPPGMSALTYALNVAMFFVVPLGWGLVVRFRRQVLLAVRREARLERLDHQRRLAQARRAERQRIAREMHDVLAHRISLLSVHAGALAYRGEQARLGAAAPLSGTELAQAVQVIRDNAHRALTELREVLTVLRDNDRLPEPGDDDRESPQPLLRDIEALVAEARAAGQPVTLELDPAVAGAPPRPQEQRTIYRVVQEGLTNARKHAPAAPVAVRVAGQPGAALAVAVTNPLPGSAGQPRGDIPGTGAGLAGLAERVALEGGTLRHGRLGDDFQLVARLPWHE